jgi:hypothetical protein
MRILGIVALCTAVVLSVPPTHIEETVNALLLPVYGL